MALTGRLVEVSDLSAEDRLQMLSLMQRHYEHVSPAVFHSDLNEKQWVIQVSHAGELCGFSTQMALDATVDERPIRALFSGDTIIDRQHWGDSALMKLGGELALSLAEQHPDEEWYWFLISQGYKTYRFLPVFFREFYPRYDAPTPAAMQEAIDALVSAKFGSQYDPVCHIVRPAASQYRLREGVADVTEERRSDPHIQYFVEKNPGHVQGDELCCIAPLSRENLTKAAHRILNSNE